MTGHFKMFNYTLSHVEEPLSEDILKNMHKNLKEGVFEDLADGYAIGEYKTRANMVADIETSLPKDVPDRIRQLLSEYNRKDQKSLSDIAILHARFESIHPFQDGNGRVGRMIIFKECLTNGLIPVIIKDLDKVEYMRHLNNAQKNNDYNGLTDYFKREQNKYVAATAKFLYDYQELDDIVKNLQAELQNEE